MASGGSWKKRELRVSLPGAPAWVPCLLLPVRGHFHPPHLGSKGRTGWLTLTPGLQEVRNNLGLWVWPACLGGPPDGLGSSPELAGVQHLAKGQHGAGHRQRERGHPRAASDSWHHLVLRPASAGQEGVWEEGNCGSARLLARAAWLDVQVSHPPSLLPQPFLTARVLAFG